MRAHETTRGRGEKIMNVEMRFFSFSYPLFFPHPFYPGSFSRSGGVESIVDKVNIELCIKIRLRVDVDCVIRFVLFREILVCIGLGFCSVIRSESDVVCIFLNSIRILKLVGGINVIFT